jgi:hypothetical protein
MVRSGRPRPNTLIQQIRPMRVCDASQPMLPAGHQPTSASPTTPDGAMRLGEWDDDGDGGVRSAAVAREYGRRRLVYLGDGKQLDARQTTNCFPPQHIRPTSGAISCSRDARRQGKPITVDTLDRRKDNIRGAHCRGSQSRCLRRFRARGFPLRFVPTFVVFPVIEPEMTWLIL